MNYKCPVCGNEEYIESPLINRDGYISTSYNKQSHFQPRGLITYNLEVRGDASCTESFENNCIAKICTNCGFVSIHAEGLVKQILNDINSLKFQQNYLSQEKNKLVSLIEELETEQKNIPQKLSETNKELEDENITVKYQKELQEQVEYLKNRTKDINNLVENAKNKL